MSKQKYGSPSNTKREFLSRVLKNMVPMADEPLISQMIGSKEKWDLVKDFKKLKSKFLDKVESKSFLSNVKKIIQSYLLLADRYQFLLLDSETDKFFQAMENFSQNSDEFFNSLNHLLNSPDLYLIQIPRLNDYLLFLSKQNISEYDLIIFFNKLVFSFQNSISQNNKFYRKFEVPPKSIQKLNEYMNNPSLGFKQVLNSF